MSLPHLDDSTVVSEIEDVMSSGRRRAKMGLGGSVHVQGAAHNLLDAVVEHLAEASRVQMPKKNLRE